MRAWQSPLTRVVFAPWYLATLLWRVCVCGGACSGAAYMPRTSQKRGSACEAPRSKSVVCSLALPLDPIVPHLAALLREAIAGQSKNMDAREVVFWASWTFPLVCREARQLSQIDGLRWLWLFERHVLQKQIVEKQLPNGQLVRCDACVRMCDGLPPWFDVHAQVQLSTRPEESRWYRGRQIDETNHVVRRCDMALRCATGCLFPHHKDLLEHRGHPENVRELNVRAYIGIPSDYDAPDLDHLVPTAVLQFVGFLRWWIDCALLRDQHNRLYNLSCTARGCSRPASVRAQPLREATRTLHAPGYWPLVRCGVQKLRDDSQWPSNQLWCCNSCEEAGTAEFFERVHCCSEAELEALPRATRSTRRLVKINNVSPARLLTAALERNALVARRLREQTRRPGGLLKTFPINGEALQWYHEMFIDALNVDVGILYAAAHLSSWPPCQRPARQLPSTADWRDQVHFYVRAICNVRRIYIRTMSANRGVPYAPRTASDLHTNPNTPPKWMLALREELSDIF